VTCWINIADIIFPWQRYKSCIPAILLKQQPTIHLSTHNAHIQITHKLLPRLIKQHKTHASTTSRINVSPLEHSLKRCHFLRNHRLQFTRLIILSRMSGGKGKSHGGKTGGKGGAARDGRAQISHSARAGLQVLTPASSSIFMTRTHDLVSRRSCSSFHEDAHSKQVLSHFLSGERS